MTLVSRSAPEAQSEQLARIERHYDIEQFLFREAALLDDRRFDDWLDLLADDLEYWMPVRSTRSLGDESHEFAKFGESAFFDDDKPSMEMRVRKLRTGYAWAEDPPSRTRHCVSNLRLGESNGDEVLVHCNFMLYRSRLASDEDLWVGRREDRLRSSAGTWKIVKRHIYLDHVSLSSKNLSIFF